MEFPRPVSEKSAEGPTGDKPKTDETVDGYLLLQPVEVGELDVVIEGIAVDADGNEINITPEVKSADNVAPPKSSETIKADASPAAQDETQTPLPAEKRVSHPLSRSRSQVKPSQNLPHTQNIPEGQWVYFIKGKVSAPLDTQTFRDLLLRGELSQSVLTWKKGMDSWQPAEVFEELKVEIPTISPGEISFHDDASMTALKMLSSRLQLLLWLAVILWAVVILMFLTRKTLEDLGIQAYLTCVIVMLSFSLAGVGMGIMIFFKHFRSFVKSGGKAFAEWLTAMVAFVCAIAIAFSVYTHFDPTPVFENVEHYQNLSREGFDYLYAGNFNDTLNKVNWSEFIFNDRNVGNEFKLAGSQKQKMLIIAEVMDKLREQINAAPVFEQGDQPETQTASQPVTKPATQPATKPSATQPVKTSPDVYSWLVIKQTVGDTVVLGRSRNGHRINVTIRSGMITAISIK